MTSDRRKELRTDPAWMAKENRRRRLWRRAKIKANPDYATKENENNKAWLKKKIARCPQYAQLQPLRSRINQLRVKLEYHQQIVLNVEKDLVAKGLKYQKLSDFCKGK